MKGQELLNHVIRAEMPDMDQVRETCVRQTAPPEQHKKRPFLRSLAMTAAATAIVICFLIGNMVLAPESSNLFSVKAYALEQQADGSIRLRDHEIDEQGQSESLSIWDKNYSYTGIYLDIERQNIENVAFFAEGDGLFLKARFLLDEEGKLALHNYQEYYDDDGNYTGNSGNPVVRSMEGLGNSITLDDIDSLPEDFFLFAGKPNPNHDYIYPLKVTIRAVVTFNDGTTQEETFVVS